MPDIGVGLGALLAKISAIIEEQNLPAYLVGGFVRSWLLHKETDDIDIAVGGDALRLAQELSQSLSGKYVLLDQENMVARVIVTEDKKTRNLDFAAFHGSIQSDLARRDFTINAMALELEGFVSRSAQLVDPFGGRDDLKRRLIKAVSPQIFSEDPARLMRAVRLAAELRFKIDSGTENLIRQDCGLSREVPGEKLREELLRLAAHPERGKQSGIWIGWAC